MCGRVILTLSAKMIEEILKGNFDVEQLSIDDFIPRYNIGPEQKLLSVIQHQGKNRAGYMDWHFEPSIPQNSNQGFHLINARSESIHEKVSFRDAFFKRRCLVICNGFYEWHRQDGVKTPYFFHKSNLEPFALGGIWNPYIKKDGSKSYGISLITTNANETMSPIHHRMPVIIKAEDISTWLSASSPQTLLAQQMLPVEKEYLSVYQVSSFVNNIRNGGIQCIEKVSQ